MEGKEELSDSVFCIKRYIKLLLLIWKLSYILMKIPTFLTSFFLDVLLMYCLCSCHFVERAGNGATVNIKRKVVSCSESCLQGTQILYMRREHCLSDIVVGNHCIQANRVGTASQRTQSFWQDSSLKRAVKKRNCHSDCNFQSAWQGTSKQQKSLEEIPRKSFTFPRIDISVKHLPHNDIGMKTCAAYLGSRFYWKLRFMWSIKSETNFIRGSDGCKAYRSSSIEVISISFEIVHINSQSAARLMSIFLIY